MVGVVKWVGCGKVSRSTTNRRIDLKQLNILLLIQLAIALVAGYGWVYNIIKLIDAASFGGMEIARAIGILVAPLGVVLGYL